jgi:hypothetical protein
MAESFDIDTVIRKIEETRKQSEPDAQLTKSEIKAVCRKAAEIIAKEPALIRI